MTRNNMPNKKRVHTLFRKSIESYSHNAKTQALISQKLAGLLYSITGGQNGRVLEIGCGTGFLTRNMLSQTIPKVYTVNDLVEEMHDEVMQVFLEMNAPNWLFLPGDAERIAFPDSQDCVVSSSSVQWLANLPAFLQKVHKCLKPNGWFACSTFGPLNMHQVKQVSGKGLNYTDMDSLKELVGAHFDVIHISSETHWLYFESALELLRHIKQTGVNATAHEIWTRKRLADFENEYKNLFANDQGLPLTYEPIYIIARKR